MDSDFADKLKAAIGNESAPDDPIAIPSKGAACLGNFKGTIQEAFNRYRAEYAEKDFEDPRGICVTLHEENFPKLIKLKYQPKPTVVAQKARASAVLEHLRNGTFDESKHFSDQPIRLRTLFWIEDVICRPDGIHPNCAAVVEGEEVYFKRYDREEPEVKLVFTAVGHAGHRIIITSFLARAAKIASYCGTPPLWPPKK
jgi:hypothetical protein